MDGLTSGMFLMKPVLKLSRGFPNACSCYFYNLKEKSIGKAALSFDKFAYQIGCSDEFLNRNELDDIQASPMKFHGLFLKNLT